MGPSGPLSPNLGKDYSQMIIRMYNIIYIYVYIYIYIFVHIQIADLLTIYMDYILMNDMNILPLDLHNMQYV